MSSETLRHPELVALYHFWLHHGGTDGVPSAADLSPAQLRRWLDNLVVMDIIRHGEPRYSYYGANLAQAFGIDMVGKTIDQLPAPQRSVLAQEYDMVRTQLKPASRTYTANFDGSVQTWERLLLPFFDTEGEVEKIIVAVYRLD
jgi:hypothetical protein